MGELGYRFKTSLKEMLVRSQDTLQMEFTHDYKTGAIRKRKTLVLPVEKPSAGFFSPAWINPLPAQAGAGFNLIPPVRCRFQTKPDSYQRQGFVHDIVSRIPP